MNRYVILHNIRSAHNVGSIFRSADGAGIRKIFLTGYTPCPTDRFGRVREDIQKTSLGATETVPWEYAETTEAVILKLKAEGVSIVAIEQHERSQEYRSVGIVLDVAFILGNEIEGVPQEICAVCDHVLHIKMEGKKESLNVSVAAGIILFHFA